ncbi:hypothetical protein [Pleomorphochaeta sp. DL1XJH-081]|jgi:hypothetical protein|uniref:hypothetical protein n=1 Tax=Pleomorphochaeta sp. DL1XJH-081 TaxID=3409690 RepID=UPI003BB7E98B
MIDSNSTFDTMRLCGVAIDNEATIASLIDRVHDGETAGHYCLTDEKGTVQGIVTLQDVLEFLTPYILFTDGDAWEQLLATVGTVPLKKLAHDSYPNVSLCQDLPNIISRFFRSKFSKKSSIDDNLGLVQEMSYTQVLKKLPRQGRENEYAVS